MLKYVMALVATFMISTAPIAAKAAATVGQNAPDFSVTDDTGATRNLSDFKGQIVVLEWTNPECPFVGKHYKSGNMQKLQKEAVERGVIWLRVNSSAPGKQGYMKVGQAIRKADENKVEATATLLDPNGTIGKAYGAKTTPQMFIIDKEGKVAYAGGIDSISSVDVADVAKADKYFEKALDDVEDGRAVSVATTKPYGCSVKYADE